MSAIFIVLSVQVAHFRTRLDEGLNSGLTPQICFWHCIALLRLLGSNRLNLNVPIIASSISVARKIVTCRSHSRARIYACQPDSADLDFLRSSNGIFDMIELVQFPWSPYCLLLRRILEFSGAPFKIINIPPQDRTGLSF